MLKIDRNIEELASDRPGHLPPDVYESTEPLVLRGLVRHWPLVREALEAPAGELPEPAPASLDPDQRAALKDLREQLRVLAEALSIAPEAALSGAELELLVREADGLRITPPARWSGWREQALLAPLRALLRQSAET